MSPPRAGAPGAWIPLLGLGACTEAGESSSGLWWFASLALLLGVGLAFTLGRALERQRSARALRHARTALHIQEGLQSGWRWQTDMQHRLLTWQGPGTVSSGPCALFEPGPGDTLLAQLRTQQAFGPLRVVLPAAHDGACAWQVHGVPRLDDQGVFCGFSGHAVPADAAEARWVEAAATGALLAAWPAAALLARLEGPHWRLLQANEAATKRWPGLLPGAALAPVLTEAPPLLEQACAALQPGRAQEIQGWRLTAFGPLPDGGRGLLVQLPAEASAPATTPEADNFSFTVSHDLRAPIRVVEGFTRIVKEDYGRLLDRVGNDHLDRVLGAAARMNQMIDALLTLARLSQQPLAHQPVNLSQLAGFVMDDLRRAAPEREADIEIEPGLVVQGDPTLLRLVLENLLGNAWKYSARNRRAHISLRRVPHGAGMAFVVRDNGAGFEMRSAERLFGLFQRLHSTSEFPGTGVGLASVRRIVQRHGGEIWAEAEVGRGAAFYFTLAA